MSQEANYSFTVKTPRGNLFTVRGDTAGETAANLAAAASSGLLGKIAAIEASLSGQPAPANPPPAAPGPSEDWKQTQQASQEQPAQELPDSYGVKCDTCGAPARLEQQGISKKSGLPFKRYSCTASQLHKATFTN